MSKGRARESILLYGLAIAIFIAFFLAFNYSFGERWPFVPWIVLLIGLTTFAVVKHITIERGRMKD